MRCVRMIPMRDVVQTTPSVEDGVPTRAWFKRATVWVTLWVLVPATRLARSASEGSGYAG